MSDANRVTLRYWEESTWGEVTGTPTFKDLRILNESLKGTKQTEVSEEIRSDRQIPSIIRTGIGAEGPINIELSMVTYEDFFRALFMAAAWSAQATVISASAVSVTAASGTFTLDSGTWTTTPTAGQIVRISGFTGIYTGNNGYFKVAASPAPTTTTFVARNKDDMVDVSGAAAITIIQGAQIVNGVAETSFSIEREPEDLSSVFMLYTGMMPSAFSLSIPVDGKITGTWTFMGKQETGETATSGDGSPTAVNDNPVVSSANDIQFINIDHGSVCLMSGSIEITNNLREIRCAGELALNSIGVGRFGITGDLELLFTSLAQKTKYLAHTAAGFMVAIEDSETSGALSLGNGMVIEIPAFQMSDEETVAGGVDTELVESISFEAFMDATEEVTARATVFPAA
jgi:hypothetical protein